MVMNGQQDEEWRRIVVMVEHALVVMQQGREEITVESIQAWLGLQTGMVYGREMVLGALIDLFEREVRRWVIETDE